MKRYIIKLTPKDFYFEEMNHMKLFDGDIAHFSIPTGDYAVGDLITFDYGVAIDRGFTESGEEIKKITFSIQRTYKIDEILPPKEKDLFALVENGLLAVIAHYHDHTRDSEEIKAATEVIELK